MAYGPTAPATQQSLACGFATAPGPAPCHVAGRWKCPASPRGLRPGLGGPAAAGGPPPAAWEGSINLCMVSGITRVGLSFVCCHAGISLKAICCTLTSDDCYLCVKQVKLGSRKARLASSQGAIQALYQVAEPSWRPWANMLPALAALATLFPVCWSVYLGVGMGAYGACFLWASGQMPGCSVADFVVSQGGCPSGAASRPALA